MGVWADVARSVGMALGRLAHVVLVQDTELSRFEQVRLHSPGMGSTSAQSERVIRGDVVVIHDAVDVLLVSCSWETDLALRRALEDAGYPAAAQVVRDADTIQRGGEVLDWIKMMNQECNNPAELGHRSPGVTVDWGLHDGQTTYAAMLSTELGARGSLPRSTQHLRAGAYEAHRQACLTTLSASERGNYARKRMSTTGEGQTSSHVMLPMLRMTSSPKVDDEHARAATAFEGVCRSAASDISTRFFSTLPGVRALNVVQAALKWGEEVWSSLEVESPCPFRGGTDYLYTKGSISQQGTKGWHDDANGPACLTCWQNLGVVEDEQLELVVGVHGCRVVVEANLGKTALFMAWLPHRTQLRGADGCARQRKTAVRLHHSAYVRFGTEYAATTLAEYKRRGLPLRWYVTR